MAQVGGGAALHIPRIHEAFQARQVAEQVAEGEGPRSCRRGAGERGCPPHAIDPEAAGRLWRLSEHLMGPVQRVELVIVNERKYRWVLRKR